MSIDTIGVRYVHSYGADNSQNLVPANRGTVPERTIPTKNRQKAEIKYIGWDRFKIPYRKEKFLIRIMICIHKDGFSKIYHEAEEIQWNRT